MNLSTCKRGAMIITIDGPVASGKSTAARNLARLLGFHHLDSGAIYRSLALMALRESVEAGDDSALADMMERARITIDDETVRLCAEDVTDDIRLPEVTRAVRPLAENPQVRAFVRELERAMASGRDIVVEGRDMGTVVFPDADLKFYLTSSDEERARRRWEELAGRGTPQDLETVLSELRARDTADMTRGIAPLKKAEGAVVVDSTGWSARETLEKLHSVVNERLGGRL